MTRYFITGGFGFLGQYIVQAIHDHDPQGELRVLVRTPRPTYLPIRSLERLRLVTGDLNQPESYAGELLGADVVIHNAALVSFKPADREALFRANIAGTQALAQAAAERGCPNFIFISSISAIGHCPGEPADETCLPDLQEKLANDPYGYSKRIGELEVFSRLGGQRVLALNPSVILGPGSARVDQVAGLVRRLPLLPMITTMNSFVDVRDVAQAVVLALSRGQSGERYIVTSDNLDMLSFARLALQVAGSRAAVVPLSGRLVGLGDGLVALADRLGFNPGIRKLSDLNVDKVYSTDKIRRELGWAPAVSLEQSLKDTLAAGA